MISKDFFKEYCIEQFDNWFQNFTQRQYIVCNEICSSHISLCKEIIQTKAWDTEEDNNVAYITGVLFKGLTEFIQIAELTRDRKWHLDHERTENIWRLMWNSIDRFQFCSTYFQSENFSWIQETLQKLHDNFINHFGHGLYSSPEILIKKEICSICKEDIRACIHVSGNLYNGQICNSIPQDIKMLSVSLVTVPRDPRCRVWSWNMKEDNTFACNIMVLFSIDDWLIEKQEENNVLF